MTRYMERDIRLLLFFDRPGARRRPRNEMGRKGKKGDVEESPSSDD
jgi:hypothetical protein